MKKSKRSRATRSFQADHIKTKICQAICRDFERTIHGYGSPTTLNKFKALQLRDLSKKYCSQTYERDTLEQVAFQKFLKINENLKNLGETIVFPGSRVRVQRDQPEMDQVHLRARALLHFVLGSLSEDEWFQHCKNSSGSSIGVPYVDTSIEQKFTFPMSCTSRVVPLTKRYMDFDFQLKSAVLKFNNRTILGDDCISVVEGSRATTVDKTDTVRRMICVEPTWNMFFQQGLMQVMYKRMKAIGLDVASLPMLHTRLAFESSITHRNGTIDWSSASDCVLHKLVEWILPPDWLWAVNITRCSSTVINGKTEPLYMFATMGNAVTFPLETLLFWCYGHAVRLTLNRDNTLFPEWEDLSVISVFGDDCIVPSNVSKPFIRALSNIGFIINEEKSFISNEGFRESCGGDYLHGVDVRPYFLRSPQNSRLSSLEPWLYSIMNGLLSKYRSYFGDLSYIYDQAFFKECLLIFQEYNFTMKIVPDDFPDDSGFKISDDLARFLACYNFRFSKIAVSEHGEYSFSYLRFSFRKERRVEEALRYCVWLKKPYLSEDPILKTRKIRRIGGYVVAKGRTVHWTFPRLSYSP